MRVAKVRPTRTWRRSCVQPGVRGAGTHRSAAAGARASPDSGSVLRTARARRPASRGACPCPRSSLLLHPRSVCANPDGKTDQTSDTHNPGDEAVGRGPDTAGAVAPDRTFLVDVFDEGDDVGLVQIGRASCRAR